MGNVEGKALLFDANTLFTHPLLIQHVISLVYDEDFDIVHRKPFLPDTIQRSARGSNDNMRRERLTPLHHGRDRELRLCLGELPHCLNDTHDLPSELASGGKDESLRFIELHVDA